MLNFGDIVKTRRKELGLSQKDLAEKAICSVETVWGLENANRCTRMDIIQDILSVLGMKLVAEVDDA